MNAHNGTDWRCIMTVISREDIWDLVTWRDKRLFQRSTQLRSLERSDSREYVRNREVSHTCHPQSLQQ